MIMKHAIFLLFIFLFPDCTGQTHPTVKSTSELEHSRPDRNGMPSVIQPLDTSPAWNLDGQKLLITGIVYQPDGKTPAPNVVVYYYHTNTEGKYLHDPGHKRSMPPNELGQTHGYIRGWTQTGADGKYAIYTTRPGAYPGRSDPAHIHLTVQEPDGRAYYIDDVVFDDDRLLTGAKRKKMENRGGSGVVRLVAKNNLMIGERNIRLGLHVPDYPKSNSDSLQSGQEIGEDVRSFTPFHAWGADKGSHACPVCKYGWYHGILYFVGNNPDWSEIRQWLIFLEKESYRRDKYLKVYFIYGNSQLYQKEERQKLLENLGKELDLKKVALTFVPSFNDEESEIHLSLINPDVENTFLLYKRSNIVGKFINLKPNSQNFQQLTNCLGVTENEFFKIPNAH